jgi:sulfotransferase family protein
MFDWRPISLGSMHEIEPVFIVGAGRSGTTPLQLALNMHPELGVYGETQAFFVHRRFGAQGRENSFRRLLEYWRVVVSGCCPYTDLLDSEDIQYKLAHAPSYAHVLDLIMGAIAAREGKSRWGEKSPAHIFRIAEIRASFPNARIIHIVRDPRAVVSSTIKAFRSGQFNDWNIYRVARYWVRCVKVHARQVATPADRYMLIRYEDFVTRPQTTLNTVCSFLGIKFAEEMLNAHRVALDYVRPDRSGNMPALHAMTQKPLDSGRTDAWKNVLSSTQSKFIEQIAGQQMTALGYQPTRKEYSPPKMRALRLSTRWALSESSRIALSQIRAPYWALRRVVDSGRNALKELGTTS